MLIYIVGWLAALAALLTFICVTVPYPALITKTLKVTLLRPFFLMRHVRQHLLVLRVFV